MFTAAEGDTMERFFGCGTVMLLYDSRKILVYGAGGQCYTILRVLSEKELLGDGFNNDSGDI